MNRLSFLSKIVRRDVVGTHIACLPKPIVFTNGVFDVLHKGHVVYLEQARELGVKAQDTLLNAKPYLEKSIKEQPMTTLAAMAAVGFLLGALWKK